MECLFVFSNNFVMKKCGFNIPELDDRTCASVILQSDSYFFAVVDDSIPKEAIVSFNFVCRPGAAFILYHSGTSEDSIEALKTYLGSTGLPKENIFERSSYHFEKDYRHCRNLPAEPSISSELCLEIFEKIRYYFLEQCLLKLQKELYSIKNSLKIATLLNEKWDVADKSRHSFILERFQIPDDCPGVELLEQVTHLINQKK